MPRGRHKKTPKWAREESELWILEALKRRAEGARFGELLDLLSSKLSRQTLSTRLRSLYEEEKIRHDYLTKRYMITEMGRVELEKEEIIAEIRAQQNVGRLSIRDVMTGYLLRADKPDKLVKLKERTDVTSFFKLFAYGYLFFECLNAALPEEVQDKLWLSFKKGEELPDEVLKLLPKDKVMFVFSIDPQNFTEILKEMQKSAKEEITEPSEILPLIPVLKEEENQEK